LYGKLHPIATRATSPRSARGSRNKKAPDGIEPSGARDTYLTYPTHLTYPTYLPYLPCLRYLPYPTDLTR
jgi:hypothetical protein